MKRIVAVAAALLVSLAPAAYAQDKVIKVGALKLIHSITPHFYEKFAPPGTRIVRPITAFAPSMVASLMPKPMRSGGS